MMELLVYENHDVFLRHPTRAYVPSNLDTLEGFLEFVSTRIAALSGDRTAAGRYRFVYSIDGSPLWRASACREAGVVVVSCTPGFLPRKVPYNTPVYLSAGVNTPLTAFTTSSSDIIAALHRPLEDLNSGPTTASVAATAVAFSQENGNSISESIENTFTGGHYLDMLPSPHFPEPALGAESEMSHADRCGAVHTLISRKLLGCSFILDDVLFQEELQSLLTPTFEQNMLDGSSPPVRIVIEGPPKSGVSTALAYACYLAATVKPDRFRNCLYLPLNFELLFDSSTSKYIKDSYLDDALLLPSSFWFIITRHVVDCAVSQRPSLRHESAAIAEAWQQIAEPWRDGLPPKFAGYKLAHLVGHHVLDQWNCFAATATQIIGDVTASPRDESIRDVFIEMLLCGFVAQIAAGLRFSGVVYVIDGVKRLTNVLRHRVRRPSGDTGVLLRSLMSRPSAHVFVGMDSLLLPSHAVIPPHAQRVNLLHTVSNETLISRYGYPSEISCGSVRFPLEMLLGVPGYMHVLHTLLRGGDIVLKSNKPYRLRVDDEEVLTALRDLASALQIDGTL